MTVKVLFDDTVQTDYGQFDLIWGDDVGFDGDDTRFFAGQTNGLAGAASGEGVYLPLARRSGDSPVRIELWDAEPDPDAAEWEDVVEVSMTVPADGQPRWSSWAGESGGPLDLPGGEYRLRVSARGRDDGVVSWDAATTGGEDDVVDFYLLQLWPAPARPDAIVRTTSNDAQHWHVTFGSRR